MYKAFVDIGDRNHSEFRINPKHAIGTTLLGPGLIFDLNRVVQTFHSKFRYDYPTLRTVLSSDCPQSRCT
jgi:hypothetical protein